jgi:opacity protein-like surface antigen
MKKGLAVIGVTVLCAVVAAAQDAPRMETFLGYTYVRANSATNVPAFSANGGGGQFVYNFNKWIGAVADLGAVHNGNIGGANLDSTFANFVFGPRVSMRYSRFHPYFQILWGGVFAATSTQIHAIVVPTPLIVPGNTIVVDPGQAVTARIGANQTAFAMTVGGGFDIKISKHMSFRPIGLDYYMTRLQNLRSQNDNNQNNIRYTTGLNFTFGAQ